MRFKTVPLHWLAGQLGAVTLEGDPATEIRGVAGLAEAGPHQLSFLANPRYAKALGTTRAGAVIVPAEAERPAGGAALLRSAHPYLDFARALTLLVEPAPRPAGVWSHACVESTATLGEGVTVMAGAYVGADCEIGAGTVLYPGAVVMERCRLGSGCLLYPGAVVREECVLGERVILHPNVNVGGDGYGFAQHEGHHFKVPQVGNVVIEDDVEIGAGTCIDRATLGSTTIGRGTKIDDLVMIGHGSKVGAHSLIVAQSGMAGSAVLEDGVTLGARAGILGHLTVGAGSVVYSRAHVTKSVPPGAVVSGNPARPHAEELRQEALLARIDRLVARVRALEAQAEGQRAPPKPPRGGKGPRQR